MNKKKTLILGQIGSPKTTKVSDVRSYLREFLSDPRVIDIPKPIWFIILNCFILPTRPKKSAEAYKRIEFCGFFPLVEITHALGRGLNKFLPENYHVKSGFLLSEPRFKDEIKKAHKRGEEVWVLPQFPQFSDTTTSCFYDKTEQAGLSGKINFIDNYHRLKAFIQQSARQIEKQIAKYPVDDIVLSFHGIPVRYVTQKKDIYYQHCYETFILIKNELNFPKDKIHISFQSRLGAEKWLSPYTDIYCSELAKNGSKSIAVYCPSFVADCLETTDEIGNELREELEEHGAELTFVPCLNNSNDWVRGYGEYIHTYIEEGKEKAQGLCYDIDPVVLDQTMPKLITDDKENLTPKAKKTLKIVFLTLFLDLVGFSIIFPMFPALAKHYLTVDQDNYFLQLIFGTIDSFTATGGSSMSSIVLFGGALGALYSLLQFIAAPLWGSFSDRVGRRTALLISVFGLFVSYIIWIFSGSFTLLILSRFIGGIMGGNLSVATAAVADVTTRENRSKGMAFVGIAFACGFLIGPAIGGVLTLYNPILHNPQLAGYGVNPFSMAAGCAAILALINLISIFRNFEETLDPEKREKTYKTSNILKIFKPLPIKIVNQVNWSYFLFISIFSGMEFTLTFLAVERFANTSMQNAYMFIFIGVIIGLVQGGVVRRKARIVGEKKMALQGLTFIIPGLILLGVTGSKFLFYIGLLFLAVGSALTIPTLTALVSIFSPDKEQGRSLGIFRSLGSLGRVIGPIFASLVYWKFGSETPYLIGAALLIVPCLILTKVKDTRRLQDDTTVN